MAAKKNLRHRRVRRTKRLKMRNRRIISAFILIASFLCISGYLIHKFYTTYKYKDLQFAIEDSLTSGSGDTKLLRVKNIELVFKDNTSAVVEATGLSKEEPHTTTTVKGYYVKGFMNSWKLDNVEKIDV